MSALKFNSLSITVSLVTELIAQQFPEWSYLSIKQVEKQGHDNRTFRLGGEMLIRLPSAECYNVKVAKEQKWLPILAQHLSVLIPQPLAMGQPSQHYPFNWSVYRWIEGQSGDNVILNEDDLQSIAISLAQFLNELHKINTFDAPIAGIHNFWRGGLLKVYDIQTRSAIEQLKKIIDVDVVTSVWEDAISSTWNEDPVWIHGDLSSGNILIKDKKLTAIIDFGGMSIGDHACDLTIAWTFLTEKSHKSFKAHLQNIHADTWARARGWALWKALITLVPLKDRSSIESLKQIKIIESIII